MAKKIIQFDWALKKLLRQKANYDILEGFLSVLLKQDIIIKNILDSESNKETENDKFNRVDIFAETNGSELIIIELQVDNEVDYFQRMAYGTSKAITECMSTGDKYVKVKKVYSVNIVYFDLGQGKDYVYHGTTEFKGMHQNDILTLSEKQKQAMPHHKISDIFPEYYVLKVNDFNDLAKDKLDEWIYVLKNSEVKEEFTAQGLDKVKVKLNYEGMSESEKNRYNEDMLNKSNAKSTLWTAKVEGVIAEKKETAFRGFDMGLDNDMIIKLTSLSLSEVEVLRQEWETQK
ncbi:MAG: Rpn family recombination-promoting nuclease/putative transposase [Bacteroidota bacterium]